MELQNDTGRLKLYFLKDIFYIMNMQLGFR